MSGGLRNLFASIFGRTTTSSSANVAKDRLKIMIQQQRRSQETPLAQQQLANDVLAVIQKHWAGVDTQDIKLNVRHGADDLEIFEMQVKLPKEQPDGCEKSASP